MAAVSRFVYLTRKTFTREARESVTRSFFPYAAVRETNCWKRISIASMPMVYRLRIGWAMLGSSCFPPPSVESVFEM
jgi:hypothetical protein